MTPNEAKAIIDQGTQKIRELRARVEHLEEISKSQSKHLAEALKIKNDALASASAQSDTIQHLRQEITRLQGELNRFQPKPKFKAGQIVRITGSSGEFYGYHKIKNWTLHPNTGDLVRYNFEPESKNSIHRFDGTGEQYLIAVTPGEIA